MVRLGNKVRFPIKGEDFPASSQPKNYKLCKTLLKLCNFEIFSNETSHDLQSKGGSPIEIDSKISKLITYGLAIFII